MTDKEIKAQIACGTLIKADAAHYNAELMNKNAGKQHLPWFLFRYGLTKGWIKAERIDAQHVVIEDEEIFVIHEETALSIPLTKYLEDQYMIKIPQSDKWVVYDD